MPKPTQVGLDIGSYSIKIIEISLRKKTPELINCDIKPISNNVTLEEKINFIKNFYKELGITNNQVNISICGKNVIVRYATFSYMSKNMLINSLKFEYGKYIPFSLEESIVDVDILEKTPDNKMNVLIVAAKKNYIEEKVNFLKQIGVIPKTITVNTIALYKAFLKSEYFSKNSSFIIINIGATITNLLIINKNIPIFSRDINIGGENFTRFISEKMNLSFKEAEDFKINLKDRTSLENVLLPQLKLLTNEINLFIEYVKKNYNLKNIECVYLSGGSSKLNGLIEFLENNLNLKVNLWNPFTIFKNSKKFKVLENFYPELILPLGTALS